MSSQTYKISEQQKELAAAGHNSSILSPFIENLSEFNERDNEFVPSTSAPLDPFSEEYHQALMKTLALSSPKYAHVGQDILQPATYAYITSPVSGIDHVTPVSLMFRRHAFSPEVLSFGLPPAPLSIFICKRNDQKINRSK